MLFIVSIINQDILYGFNVFIADGHDFKSLDEAKHRTSDIGHPTVIICNTTKGHGWKTYEDKVDCHYLPMKDDQYELVTAEVKNDFEKRIAAI